MAMTMQQGTIEDATMIYDLCAQFHQKHRKEARVGDALDQEGIPVVYQNKIQYRTQQGVRHDPLGFD